MSGQVKGLLAWLWVGIALIFASAAAADGMAVAAILLLCSAMLSAPWLRQKFGAIEARHRNILTAGAAGTALAAFIAIGVTAPSRPGAERPTSTTAPPGEAQPDRSATAQDQNLTARREFENLYSRVLRIAQPCDEANGEAADALRRAGEGSITLYDAYARVRRAKDTCEASWLDMGQLEVPGSLPEDQSGPARAAIDACKTAYFSRKESLEVMMAVVDGDQRPSTVDNYREQAEAAQAGVMLCVARLSSIGLAIGAELPAGDRDEEGGE